VCRADTEFYKNQVCAFIDATCGWRADRHSLKFIPEFCAIFLKIAFNSSQYHESFVTAPVL
jgi:hypothetical protein